MNKYLKIVLIIIAIAFAIWVVTVIVLSFTSYQHAIDRAIELELYQDTLIE